MSEVKTQEVVHEYFNSLVSKRNTGQAGEHAYRPAFETLVKELLPNLSDILNDPKKSEHGAPDFVFLQKDLIAGYAETKDLDSDLNRIEKSEQMERYFGYSNLILTNFLEFRFFRNGERWNEPIIIGTLKGEEISALPEKFGELADTLKDFLIESPEPIKSGAKLAKIMGGKARRIRDNVRDFINSEPEKYKETVKVYETIRKLLVHDLSLEQFADMYAQTLVYGLFAARFYDDTSENFSRQEARELIPKSNPFLGHFFDHIAGRNFEKRLGYIVDELCEVFRNSNVQELMKQYFKSDLWGKTHKGPDPVIHFYEDFLKEYDESLRKKMGAYYTPLPVVQFIVRSIDYLLEKEFKLPQGLADTTKTANNIHKVQILDPAVGTGTFLAEVIDNIYKKFTTQGGRWTSYIHSELLPRLHGFELMMSPYTIAHIKISMKLAETGFTIFNKDKRLGIYLTDSLEPSPIQEGMFTELGLAYSIAEESKEAAKIKNEKPIMVVLGNPPYSVSSQNKGEWIQDLIKVYKEGLGDRNIQPLSDDYIKFLRFAEHFIEKNKTGIVAMITNNSFIDGTIHRQMRKHLLETFDDIYILDLHGNAKKKEKAPDGEKDENVFAIQQGVSINIFVRKNEDKKGLGKVHHAEVFGKREKKFDFLNKSNIAKIEWKELDYTEPYFFFVPKDFRSEEEYKKGFKMDEIFNISNAGSATGKDSLYVQMTNADMTKVLQSLDKVTVIEKVEDYLYRPFDIRKIPYDKSLIQRLRANVMNHMLKSNIALIACKKQTSFNFQHIFVSKNVTDRCAVSLQTGEVGYVFPLYAYDGDVQLLNMKPEVIAEIEKIAKKVTGEDIFDYIYAILHSPIYREKYKEFLKIDFPRVPYPKDKKQFQEFVKLGKELRELHLLESPQVNKFITSYPVSGSDTVEKVSYKEGKVYINSEQYFGDVPEIAWNFYIGGYQPAQKWLKDRKGRTLTNSDIEHYQKIILALVETDRIMKEIDKSYI